MQEKLPSFDGFHRALTDREVRASLMVHLALAFGVVIFAAIVIGMFLEYETGTREDAASVVPLLTWIMLGMAVVLVPLSTVMRARLLRRGALPPGGPTLDPPAARWVVRIRLAGILQVGLLDAVVYLGLTNLLLGVIGGVLRAHPIYWINLVPACILVAWLLATLPTRERIETIYREIVLSHRP